MAVALAVAAMVAAAAASSVESAPPRTRPEEDPRVQVGEAELGDQRTRGLLLDTRLLELLDVAVRPTRARVARIALGCEILRRASRCAAPRASERSGGRAQVAASEDEECRDQVHEQRQQEREAPTPLGGGLVRTLGHDADESECHVRHHKLRHATLREHGTKAWHERGMFHPEPRPLETRVRSDAANAEVAPTAARRVGEADDALVEHLRGPHCHARPTPQ